MFASNEEPPQAHPKAESAATGFREDRFMDSAPRYDGNSLANGENTHTRSNCTVLAIGKLARNWQ
jgi:hypothetical protein